MDEPFSEDYTEHVEQPQDESGSGSIVGSLACGLCESVCDVCETCSECGRMVCPNCTSAEDKPTCDECFASLPRPDHSWRSGCIEYKRG